MAHLAQFEGEAAGAEAPISLRSREFAAGDCCVLSMMPAVSGWAKSATDRSTRSVSLHLVILRTRGMSHAGWRERRECSAGSQTADDHACPL